MTRVCVIGRGNVGSSLARAWRSAGWGVEHRAGRSRARSLRADLVVLAVRDGQLASMARCLAEVRTLEAAAVVHCAGALSPEVLAPLRATGVAVGVLHPLLSFTHGKTPLEGVTAIIWGDVGALRPAKRAARAAGLKPHAVDSLDPALYHAAAAMLANGAAALCDVATRLLAHAGVVDGQRAVAALLRSVADNVERIGLPEALSGPVRRGDVETIRAHLRRIDAHGSSTTSLYRSLVAAQIPLARRLREAPVEKFDEIEKLVAKTPRKRGKSPRS